MLLNKLNNSLNNIINFTNSLIFGLMSFREILLAKKYI